jgi:hypothetical protein
MYKTMSVIIISIVSATMACLPIKPDDIVDLRRTENEICESECAAVWNTTATAQDCQLWAEKAWWTGSACVIKCDDLKGYKTTNIKDPSKDVSYAVCISTDSTQNNTLNYYNGIYPAHTRLNTVPMWCACYDLFKFARYPDKKFCNIFSGILIALQIVFMCIGAAVLGISTVGLMCPCCCASTNYTSESETRNYIIFFLFGAFLIILSPFAMYIFVMVIAAILMVCLHMAIRKIQGKDEQT